MAKKENRISVNQFEKATLENYAPVTSQEWRGLQLEVKRLLSLRLLLGFVKEVVETCFADGDEYLPEVKDFATRCAILEYYTNISLPSNTEKRFELVYSSDIIPFVVQFVEKSQFEAMLDAIDKKIEYRVQNNIEATTKQVNDAVVKFDALQERMSDLFEGVDGKTMEAIAAAISNGSFNMDELVNRVVEAKYPESDSEVPTGQGE